MKSLLESSKYLVLAVVAAALVATVAAVVWSLYETFILISSLVTGYKGTAATVASFVQLMDVFLLVAVLYIFTVAIYELFIGELQLPKWLVINNFDQLKTILSNMIILIGAVSFLKYFLERNDPVSTLLYGLAVTAVSWVLIQYRHHEGHGRSPDQH